MNHYDLLRGLHILAVIAWMAGLLYLPRLFVYHIQNRDNPQVVAIFTTMQTKLMKIIMNPAMIMAWVFGLGLIWVRTGFGKDFSLFHQPWFVTKMIGIVAITGWHHMLLAKMKKLQRGEDIGSEKKWRMMNEVPFVLAIVMVIAVTTEFVF